MTGFDRRNLSRRVVLAGIAGLAVVGSSAIARDTPRDLNWKDLVPREARGIAARSGPVSHSTVPSRTFSDPRHYAIVPELNGMRVRIPGYLVPLTFDGTGGTEFLLVPFVGACIHVPPPPPNQLVFAVARRPYQMEGLFAPVYAVGTLQTRFEPTELAHASYTLDVERFEDVTF